MTLDTFADQVLDTPGGTVPVTDGHALVGVLGARDIRRIRRADWPSTRAGDLMRTAEACPRSRRRPACARPATSSSAPVSTGCRSWMRAVGRHRDPARRGQGHPRPRRPGRRPPDRPERRRPWPVDELLSVEAARAAVFAAIAGPTAAELAYLLEARGRVAAEPVDSPIDLPPWTNSAMDGYAIRSADVAAATDAAPVRLTVDGEVRAGQARRAGRRSRDAPSASRPARPCPHGRMPSCRSSRRRPLDADGQPPGRAAATRPARCRPRSRSTTPVAPGGSLRARGSDLAAGTPIVDAGTVLTPAVLGLAAGVGIDRLHGPPATDRRHPRDRRRGPRAGLDARARPGSRTRTARVSWPWSRRPAPSRASWASPPTASTTSAPGCAPGCSRARRDHRLRRRLGRAIRRRPLGVRGVRHHRPVAGRGPARQAVRVRDRSRAAATTAGSGAPAGAAVRTARQPGLDLRDVRAVRPAGTASAGRAPR